MLATMPAVLPAATVTTRLLPESAMYSLPATPTARPSGELRVEVPDETVMVRAAAEPPDVTLTMRLLPVSAMKMLPD
jgi:hypothetical protein